MGVILPAGSGIHFENTSRYRRKDFPEMGMGDESGRESGRLAAALLPAESTVSAQDKGNHAVSDRTFDPEISPTEQRELCLILGVAIVLSTTR